MKKALVLILSVLVVLTAFAGCSKGNDNNDQTGDPKNSPSTTSAWEATTITTDTAKIADNEAINYILSYSAKELSLSKEDKKNCSFMVTKSGVKIKDDYYIEVNAVIKHENGKDEEGRTLYTFDNKGEYYIRYDGKQVLKKDMTKDTNEYIEMEVHELPETTTLAAETESASEGE